MIIMRTISNKDTGEKSDELTSDIDASFSCVACGKTLTLDKNLKKIPIEFHKKYG